MTLFLSLHHRSAKTGLSIKLHVDRKCLEVSALLTSSVFCSLKHPGSFLDLTSENAGINFRQHYVLVVLTLWGADKNVKAVYVTTQFVVNSKGPQISL